MPIPRKKEAAVHVGPVGGQAPRGLQTGSGTGRQHDAEVACAKVRDQGTGGGHLACRDGVYQHALIVVTQMCRESRRSPAQPLRQFLDARAPCDDSRECDGHQEYPHHRLDQERVQEQWQTRQQGDYYRGPVPVTSRRVVITGIGMVTPLGHTFAATVEALGRRECATATATLFDASGFTSDAAAEVKGFDPRPYFRVPKALKVTDRTTQFAVSAAAMALSAAGWPAGAPSGERLGVIIGTSGSDLQAHALAGALEPGAPAESVGDMAVFADRMLSHLNPLWLLISLPNMPSAHVAIQLGARGPNSTVMTDGVAGSQAIGEAADWIRGGEADAVLAGGADTAIQPFAFAAFDQAGLLTPSAGGKAFFVPGEGAAVVLLEEREHALRRGAPIRGELCGYAAASAPGSSIVDAFSRTISAALHETGWQPRDVGAVGMASVAGSPLRAQEDIALRSTLGPRATTVSQHDFQTPLGHSQGASGAISLCLLLATAAGPGGLICNSAGYSGQSVTLCVLPAESSAQVA